MLLQVCARPIYYVPNCINLPRHSVCRHEGGSLTHYSLVTALIAASNNAIPTRVYNKLTGFSGLRAASVSPTYFSRDSIRDRDTHQARVTQLSLLWTIAKSKIQEYIGTILAVHYSSLNVYYFMLTVHNFT